MIYGLFGLLAVLMMLGMPVAFALLMVSAVYFVANPMPDALLVQRFVSGIDSFPLLAVAFFVLLGSVLARGGIAERLLGFADSLVGHRRGGLAQVNVLNSVLLGGMSGSANADAAIDAKILVPEMLKRNYGLGFSAALSGASGMITPMLPPGLGFIIYGLLAEVSIGRLFIGGIIPGLLIAVGLSIVVAITARVRGYGSDREKASLREILINGRAAIWALLMPVILMVGLRIGVFTPTELGAIATVYALVVAMVIYRTIPLRDIPKVLGEGVMTTASIMLIIASAGIFGWILTIERVPQQLIALLLQVSDNVWVILLILNVAILLIGMVVESNSLLVILTPMLAPVAAQLGIDPIHFGVVLVLNLTIGSMTPPIGTVMFTICSMTGCTPEVYSREVVKFVVALITVLGLCTYIPSLVTALPNYFFG